MVGVLKSPVVLHFRDKRAHFAQMPDVHTVPTGRAKRMENARQIESSRVEPGEGSRGGRRTWCHHARVQQDRGKPGNKTARRECVVCIVIQMVGKSGSFTSTNQYINQSINDSEERVPMCCHPTRWKWPFHINQSPFTCAARRRGREYSARREATLRAALRP